MSTYLAPTPVLPVASIVGLCRQAGVQTLDAFWSGLADEERRPGWAFVATFDASDDRRLAPRWVELEDGLDRLLGRPVEILGRTALENPYVRDEVAKHGQRVFPPS